MIFGLATGEMKKMKEYNLSNDFVLNALNWADDNASKALEIMMERNLSK